MDDPSNNFFIPSPLWKRDLTPELLNSRSLNFNYMFTAK